ncbi:hypothetical protein CCP2SC5_60051 [Azospirillaceae bacterium]
MATFAEALRLHQAGRWEEAEAIYLHILRETPNHIDALHLSGMIAAQSGRTIEAIARLERAVEFAPHIMEIHLHLGHALKAAGRRTEAVAHYHKAVDLAPTTLEPVVKLGITLFELGQWGEALPWMRRAWTMNSAEPELGLALAMLLVRLNRLDEAEVILKSLVNASEDSVKTLNLICHVNKLCLRFVEKKIQKKSGKIKVIDAPIKPLTIYIKSFSRPFLVDRCIRSIKAYAENYGRIVVLDDGTSQKHLETLAVRHPDIEIISSGNGVRGKYDFIRRNWPCAKDEEILAERLSNFINPAHFWANAIGSDSKAGRLALVLEEDQRLDQPFDAMALTKVLEQHNILMASLAGHAKIESNSPLDVIHHDSWHHADFVRFGDRPHEFIQFYYPILSSPRPMHSEDPYFTRDLYGFLQRLIRPSSMIIDRQYFAWCFGDMPAWITEWRAQQRALDFVARHSEYYDSGFGFACPVVRQSLFTTCRLRAQDRADGFLSFKINDALSAAWMEGNFDVMAGFPADWPEDYVRKTLTGRVSLEGWEFWRKKIVAEYQAIGATF